MRYLPYGEELWRDGSSRTDFGFTGQRSEAGFGLYDYNARYYSPYLGRFVSPDTIVPNPASSQSFNRYAYAFNNPVNLTDPSGHCPPSVCNGKDLPMDPYYISKALVVFGGSVIGNINAVGPEPAAPEGVPYFHENATESVQYPGVPGGKQGQADNVTGNYIKRVGDLGMQILGYSAGADAALIYAHDYMQAQNLHSDRARIIAIALLGPTMSGGMADGSRLDDVWHNIMDELLWQGVDIYWIDDSSGETRGGYEPPEGAPGTLHYEYRPDQAHDGFTNSNETFSNEVLDWLDEH